MVLILFVFVVKDTFTDLKLRALRGTPWNPVDQYTGNLETIT